MVSISLASSLKAMLAISIIFIFVLLGVNLGYTASYATNQCPPVICNTSALESQIFSSSIAEEKYRLIRPTVLKHAIEIIFPQENRLSSCINRCYDRFYYCQYLEDSAECFKDVLILRSCPNFNFCIEECKEYCDDNNTSVSNLNDYSSLCLNELNTQIICPKEN